MSTTTHHSTTVSDGGVTVTITVPDRGAQLLALVNAARETNAAVQWNTDHGLDASDAQTLSLTAHRAAIAEVRKANHPQLVSLLRTERVARQAVIGALGDITGVREGTDELDERLAALQRARAAVVDYLQHPQTSATRQLVEKLARHRRENAEARHASYPQYAGHWDGWELVEVTADVIVKGGVAAFRRDDVVLLKPGEPRGGFVTCYSYRTEIDTAVPVGDLRAILITG